MCIRDRQSIDSFGARGTLKVRDASYDVFRLSAVEGSAKLPFSLKVLLENLLRTEDGANITAGHIRALAGWDPSAEPDTEIQFTPARVIMQDFTGVPCIVDLATMREAVAELGGDANRINPLAPAEMVIDHSVIADVAGRADAFERNVELEYQRNEERYQFLRWGQNAFNDFKVVPPGTGIVHQVNIEHLARVVFDRHGMAYEVTCDYLRLTGRSEKQVALVEAYSKEQGLWHDASVEPVFSEYLELDLSTVVPSIAGPKRPQDRIALTNAKDSFRGTLKSYVNAEAPLATGGAPFTLADGTTSTMDHGHV